MEGLADHDTPTFISAWARLTTALAAGLLVAGTAMAQSAEDDIWASVMTLVDCGVSFWLSTSPVAERIHSVVQLSVPSVWVPGAAVMVTSSSVTLAGRPG